jgi:uncharacterized protein involved in exopolysaccharide biosynthesis
MRDPKELQSELDAAQADLEQHIGELKQLVEDKLETPIKVVEAAKKPISFVIRHPLVVCAGAIALGVAFGALHHTLRSRRLEQRR